MDCLINVEGGLGKNIMLTSILKEVKEEGGYDHVYVMSPYHDIFKCCPDVDDAFPTGQPSLYQELVLDPNVEVLWKEPYNNNKFIKKTCHLFNAWREEFNLDTDSRDNDDGATITPNVSLDMIKQEYPNVYKMAVDKAMELKNFILVQFCGGQSPLAMRDQYNDHEEGIKRNYYKGQEIINQLKSKYPDYNIVHFALPNEPSYEGAIKLEMPYVGYFVLAHSAQKVVCTDSSLQHIAAGMCDDVTVIWGETRPEHFGYSKCKNICATNVFNTQAYFRPLGVSPARVTMPSPTEVVDRVVEGDDPETGRPTTELHVMN